jgi:hypothetical protein
MRREILNENKKLRERIGSAIPAAKNIEIDKI